MRGALAVWFVLLLVGPARAQPVRGDELIERYSLQPLRPITGELAALSLSEPVVTTEQYARIVELRRRIPALARLAVVDDTDLPSIAAALCHAPSGSCVAAVTRTLRCMADRCAVALPVATDDIEVAQIPERCHRLGIRKPPRFGVGFDWGTGVQRSRYPTDGAAWSLGIESRMRVGRRLGVVGRVDRVAGRDEATDTNSDGIDDASTGSLTRISALAGPSFVLDNTSFENTRRFLRLDVLFGYLATRSQADESGPAAGIDLAVQLSVLRVGVRAVHGLGDAEDAAMLLGHLGIAIGSIPPFRDDSDCRDESRRSSRLALAIELPLGGYGLSSQLGYLATGFAFEAIWHLSRRFDVMTRADVLLFPGIDRDRVVHHAALAGFRIDHKSKRSDDTGLFSTIMAGYTHGAGLTTSTTGSGAVLDLSLGWGGQATEGAAYLRLHGRFGLGPDNTDYRAIFLSAGAELRFDRRRWRDRT